MEVSRTLAAIFRWRAARRRDQFLAHGVRRLALCLCCGASLGAVGCQSTGWLTRDREQPENTVKDELAKALNQDRQYAATNAPSTGGQTGSSVITRQLQLGDQALSEHGQNPARLAEARNHFEEVLRVDPKQPTAHHRLGVIADLTNNFTEAEKHYTQALQYNPNDPQLLHDIGYSCLLQDKPAQAVEYLKRAVELSPGFDMAARKLADAYVRTRQTELARQTLAQLMPADQVDAELRQLEASHDPAVKPSLFGRVRQNMRDMRPGEEQSGDSATQQLLAELELARQERDRTRPAQPNVQQASAQQVAPYGHPGWSQPGLAVHDSQLSQAMAAIEGQAGPQPGRAVMIDPAAGGQPQYANPQLLAAAGHPAGSGYGAGPMTGGQVPMYGVPQQSVGGYAPQDLAAAQYAGRSPMSTSGVPSGVNGGFQYAEVIRGTQRGTASPEEAFFAQQRGAAPPWGVAPQPPITPQDNVISMAGGRYTPGSLSDPRANAAMGAVQSADYTSGGQSDEGVGGAPGRQRPSMMQSPPAANGGPMANATATGPDDDYQAAAALGMGVGPGQMFPVIRRTEITSAGTGSMWNGAQYPQPGRQLPTDRPIPDLSQAFQVPSQPNGSNTLLNTAPNSLGQQNPMLGQSYTTAGQFGGIEQSQQSAQQGQQAMWTNSNFQMQSPTMGVSNGLQGYDQQRSQYDAQFNSQIQQVQGQYPSGMMNSPSYGLPVERPDQGVAMMNSWYGQPGGANTPANVRQVVTPGAYSAGMPGGPSADGAFAPQMNPQPGLNGSSSQLPPPQYGDHVVVPPSYSGGRGATQPSMGLGTSAAGGYQGPMIVPSR